MPQIIAAVLQFAMFMTPIFWRPDQISKGHFILTFNPFYYMLDAVRAPILGAPQDPRTWWVLSATAVVGWSVAFIIFAGTRRRIVHYL